MALISPQRCFTNGQFLATWPPPGGQAGTIVIWKWVSCPRYRIGYHGVPYWPLATGYGILATTRRPLENQLLAPKARDTIGPQIWLNDRFLPQRAWKMDETQTLCNLLQDTGLAGSPEFASADGADQLSPRDRHFLDWGHEKIKADAVLFQRIPVNNSSFPLAYFRRLQDDNPEVIAEAHRLAWNMGRAPLLFLVLPGKILVHSTFEAPKPDRRDGHLDPEAGLIDILDLTSRTEQARQTIAKYRREELLSGRYWELDATRQRFSPSTRIEKNLLDNLKAIRQLLISKMDFSLNPNTKAQIVHSLLGRAIFIQYLQDRKDSNGHSAFPQGYLSRFTPDAQSFADVLGVKKATYELFDELGEKFNGDIFPVTGRERDAVKLEHLSILAKFLRGKIRVRSRQLCFWPLYSFDAIPIEFISNMYEEFFHYETVEPEKGSSKRKNKEGTYYTPHRLVEFLLDEMLPWEGPATALKVLDPSCGSGIFLVEAYRRLISRWQQANEGTRPGVEELRGIMEKSLFGVDKNLEAIRVAAFSLYLTMCDYLEPRHIWNTVKFPELCDKNLWAQDFFTFVESPPSQAKDVDIIIGNPPWESSLPESAESFMAKRKRTVGDKQIAQAFLWAAPELCKQGGKLCLVAPSKGLLFNTSGPNTTFRKQFFSSHAVDLVVNFSALRRNLFAKAIGPASPVVYRPVQPSDDHKIVYCCPKPINSAEDSWHYVVSSTDIQHIPLSVAMDNPYVWKTAMWGGPRDWELIRRLSTLHSLKDHAAAMGWTHGEGFIIGNADQKKAPWLTGRPFVAADELRAFAVDTQSLPICQDTLFHRGRSRNKAVFDGPHILFAQGPKADRGFVAALLKGPAVFSQSIVGIAGPKTHEASLGAVCAALLTDVCRYHAMMTSSRWLVERDELEKVEAMSLPLPSAVSAGQLTIPHSKLQQAASNPQAARALIKAMEKAYDLDKCEQLLVEDAIAYELDYFRSGSKSKAAKPVTEPMFIQYAEMLSRSLTSSFNHDDGIAKFPVTVYTGDCPMLAVAVRLKPSKGEDVEVRRASDELREVLSKMDDVLLEKHDSGLYVQRDVHIYHDHCVYIAKRNQRRLWSRSAALRDADQVYANVMNAWGED